ncbi:hypothetical protein EI555_001953, partial [Monodon monoceros]
YSKYAISSSNISLSISSLPRNYKTLTWFYTTDQKIVEWESGQLKYFNTKFKDRVRLDLQSGTLHIHNVQKEDSSTYLLMVLKDPGYEDEWKISLVVLDPVPKPVIEVKKTQEVNKCHLTLSCVIQDQPVNYTWYAESLPKESRSSVLEVTHTPQNYSSSYTCQVSNPVSSQNNTVNFTSPCVLVPLPLLNTLIKTPKCFVFSCSFSPILWSSLDCHLASDHGSHRSLVHRIGHQGPACSNRQH